MYMYLNFWLLFFFFLEFLEFFLGVVSGKVRICPTGSKKTPCERWIPLSSIPSCRASKYSQGGMHNMQAVELRGGLLRLGLGTGQTPVFCAIRNL